MFGCWNDDKNRDLLITFNDYKLNGKDRFRWFWIFEECHKLFIFRRWFLTKDKTKLVQLLRFYIFITQSEPGSILITILAWIIGSNNCDHPPCSAWVLNAETKGLKRLFYQKVFPVSDLDYLQSQEEVTTLHYDKKNSKKQFFTSFFLFTAT